MVGLILSCCRADAWIVDPRVNHAARSADSRGYARRLLLLAGAVLACATLVLGPGILPGYSSTVNVYGDVPNLATLDTSGCNSNLSIGSVLPGSTGTTPDCVISFGSNTQTSMLRIFQADGSGVAMWGETNGSGMDTGFSGDGMLEFAYPGNLAATTNAVALAPDGDVISVGQAEASAGNYDVSIARHTSAGADDTTFGSNGRILLNRGTNSDSARAVTVSGDGEIFVVAGTSTTGEVIKLTPSGQIDEYFGGGDGIAEITASSPDRFRDIELLPDGSMLVCTTTSGNDMAVYKLDKVGDLVTAFGGGDGIATVDFGSSADRAVALELQSSGKIVISGVVGSTRQLAIARLDAAGNLDTSFGASGTTVVTAIEAADSLVTGGMDVDSKDRIIVAAGTTSIVIARFTADGFPDTSYAGVAGWTTVGPATNLVSNPVALPSGAVLVAGGTAQSRVYKLTSVGELDTNFGTSGYREFNVNIGSNDAIQALAFGIDGRVIAAGQSQGSPARATVSVIEGGLTIPNYANGTTDWDQGTSSSMFAACLSSMSGAGATAAWTVNAGCTTTDAAGWQPIVANSGTSGAKVGGTTVAGTTTVTATIRFGIRVSGTQTSGGYLAPVIFESISPNV
jgi:uncharacterized delta-60 repeat protein